MPDFEFIIPTPEVLAQLRKRERERRAKALRALRLVDRQLARFALKRWQACELPGKITVGLGERSDGHK